MNIQQNLNALLGMGAVAARTSGKYETNQELKKLNKAEQGVHSVKNELNDLYEKQGQAPEIGELINKNNKEFTDIAIEKAKLDPNKKNVKAAAYRAIDTANDEFINEAYKQQALDRYTSETDTVRSQRQAMDDRLEIIRSKANKFDKMKNLLDDYNKKQGGKK